MKFLLSYSLSLLILVLAQQAGYSFFPSLGFSFLGNFVMMFYAAEVLNDPKNPGEKND